MGPQLNSEMQNIRHWLFFLWLLDSWQLDKPLALTVQGNLSYLLDTVTLLSPSALKCSSSSFTDYVSAAEPIKTVKFTFTLISRGILRSPISLIILGRWDETRVPTGRTWLYAQRCLWRFPCPGLLIPRSCTFWQLQSPLLCKETPFIQLEEETRTTLLWGDSANHLCSPTNWTFVGQTIQFAVTHPYIQN